jgi:hypothetical protein
MAMAYYTSGVRIELDTVHYLSVTNQAKLLAVKGLT